MSSPVGQAIQFVYPCYERILKHRGIDQANLWLYEVGGKFDRFCKFLTPEEKEEVRSLVRGKHNIQQVEISLQDVADNKPRSQLFDL